MKHKTAELEDLGGSGMTTRRSFLGAILAAGMAPAVGHAGILMPVKKIQVVPALTLRDLERIKVQILSSCGRAEAADHLKDMVRYGVMIYEDTRITVTFRRWTPYTKRIQP